MNFNHQKGVITRADYKFWKLTAILFIVTSFFLLALMLHMAYTPSEAQIKQDIYDTCNKSRISPTINEQECGELQDRYNAEFLCAERNTQTDNYCWVELK